MQNQLENQNEEQIKEIYLSSIKNDIKEKIENKGYIVNSVEIEVEDDGQYTLKKIILEVEKKTETTNSNSNESESNNTVLEVNEVKINVSNTETNTEEKKSANKKNTISSQAKKEIKEYLNGVYEISTKNIFINE